MAAIEGRWKPGNAAPPATGEPSWLTEARALIGTSEIVGPRHNSFISNGWGRLDAKLGLAARYNDDETPWCGLFAAHCVDAAGLPFPRLYGRALAWNDWGQACSPVLGGIATFARAGGGHVGFLVGEDALNYYVLGGNQKDSVRIDPLAKSRLSRVRWPRDVYVPARALPKMKGGVVSTNEA